MFYIPKETVMEYLIATYRSRSKAIEVFNTLKSSGYGCFLATTPQSAKVGCGLSVRFGNQDFDNLRPYLSKVASFSGFFRVININGKTILTAI